MVRNRIDANFDWLTLDTPQEEETFGKTGLVVECVFDFVFDTLFLLVLGSVVLYSILERYRVDSFSSISNE